MVKRFGPAQRRTREIPKDEWAHFFADEEDEELENDMTLAEVGLSSRVVNALEAQSIFRVSEFLKKTREELLALPSFGESSLDASLALLKKKKFNVSTLVAPKKTKKRKLKKKKRMKR